jgi:hypothetical protein
MSGITTIVVKEGQYICLDCLNEAIKSLSLSNALDVIKSEYYNGYQISLSTKAEDFRRKQVKEKIQKQIGTYHQRILPKYTEFHAIHEFKKKGFKFIKRINLKEGYKYIFEKVEGKKFNKTLERYTISVLPKENRIIVNGENMKGRRCRQYARKFEKDMGNVKSFIPHQRNAKRGAKTKRKSQNRLRIRPSKR